MAGPRVHPGTVMAFTIRNRTLEQIARRAWADWRHLPYDLLPLSGGPGRRYWLARLAALACPRSPQPPDDPRALTLLEQLEDRGWTEPLGLVSTEQAAQMRQALRAQPCHDPYRPHLGDFPHDAVPSPETNMGYYRIDQLLAVPGLLGFFNHPLVLAVAELYLGCKPTMDNIGGWWSFAGRDAAKGTQWFHRDWDNIRAIKLFIYLTDTGPDDGPFEFVEASHRDERLVEINRMEDERVARSMADLPLRSITGAAGTIFLADTFGLHRGRLPRAHSRLMVTAQYGVWRTPFSPKYPILDRQPGLDPYINRAVMR